MPNKTGSGKASEFRGYAFPPGNADDMMLFAKLIENSHDGITLLDKDLKVIYRSKSAERVNGWAGAERAKYQLADLIHPEDKDWMGQKLKELLNSPGESVICCFRSKHSDGHYMWLECAFTNHLDDPDIAAIVCNFRDITQKKQDDEKLVESSQFVKTITDNVPAMIAYWSADLRCLFANKPYMDWFDKKPEEMIGLSKKSLMGGREYEECATCIHEVLNGKPQSFERTFIKDSGQKIDTHTRYLPDIEERRVKGFYSLIYDITDIKLAQQEIKEKSDQIDDILDNIADGFIALDHQRRYTYANKQVGKMIGKQPEELIGKKVWELFPAAVGYPTYHAIEVAFKERKYVCNEDYYEPLGLWQENRVYPTRNGVSMFIRDITHKKQEEQHLRLLAEISSIFIEEGELREILQKVLECLVTFGNYKMAEAWVIGADKQHIDLLAKYQKTENLATFYQETNSFRRFRKGESLPGIVWETKKEQLWENVNGNKLFKRRGDAEFSDLESIFGLPLIHNNKVVGALLLGTGTGTPQSIKPGMHAETLGKHIGAEIKRKQLEEELNQIFNFAGDIICIAGTDGYLKKVNPAMCDILEYSEEELLSRQFDDFVYPEDRTGTNLELKKLAHQSPGIYFENRYVTKSGAIRWLAWTSSPASEEGLIFAVAKDITDRKLSEIKLKQLNESLQKHTKELAISNAELEQFAYVASHDLQEPLRMVTSFLTQLEKKYSDVVDDKGRQYIFFAVDGAKRMRQIILDLLDFSRVGRTENDLEEVDLNKVVNEVYGLYRRRQKSLGQRLSLVICPN
jgi:PAS domain S-box-containing protein